MFLPPITKQGVGGGEMGEVPSLLPLCNGTSSWPHNSTSAPSLNGVGRIKTLLSGQDFSYEPP